MTELWMSDNMKITKINEGPTAEKQSEKKLFSTESIEVKLTP